jgi:hypothetical protein
MLPAMSCATAISGWLGSSRNLMMLKFMEQYVHTLIAADSAFVPQSVQIEKFFEILTTSYHFRIISDTRFQPGLRVMKPSGRFR